MPITREFCCATVGFTEAHRWVVCGGGRALHEHLRRCQRHCSRSELSLSILRRCEQPASAESAMRISFSELGFQKELEKVANHVLLLER